MVLVFEVEAGNGWASLESMGIELHHGRQGLPMAGRTRTAAGPASPPPYTLLGPHGARPASCTRTIPFADPFIVFSPPVISLYRFFIPSLPSSLFHPLLDHHPSPYASCSFRSPGGILVPTLIIFCWALKRGLLGGNRPSPAPGYRLSGRGL